MGVCIFNITQFSVLILNGEYVSSAVTQFLSLLPHRSNPWILDHGQGQSTDNSKLRSWFSFNNRETSKQSMLFLPIKVDLNGELIFARISLWYQINKFTANEPMIQAGEKRYFFLCLDWRLSQDDWKKNVNQGFLRICTERNGGVK
jgi:hypothetical protein